MKKAAVAFIVIAYHPNEEEFSHLLRILPSEETIVVDNGQTVVSKDIGKATLLSQSTNTGYATAANIGIRHQIAYGFEWFVILNQDVEITRTAVEDLTKQLTALEPCIAGPFVGGLDTKRWTSKLPSKRVDYISGSCLAIHKNVVEKIGYLYEPYFLYYEEADYCVRAKRAGFALHHLRVEGVAHEESVSLGKGSRAHQYYLARNHLLFVLRLAPLSVKLYEIARFPKTISEHIMHREWGALQGIWDFTVRTFGRSKGGI